MYVPAAFAEHDLARLQRLARDYPFATLVSVDAGSPVISHVPLLLDGDAGGVTLHGHFARANPHARVDGAVTAIFRGPDAYVSPGWYADKQEAARVPTWNYAVAHLTGTLATFDDEPSLAALVSRLADVHEARVGGDWRFDAAEPAQRAQLHGIVGFRIAVEQVRMKFKLSQNHPRENRERVAAALAAQRGDGPRAIASLMHAQLHEQTLEH